jgi:type III restriction enzyme
MSTTMQLKLDPNLDFQLDSIRAVVDLFKGIDRRIVDIATEYGYDIVPNLPPDQMLYETDLFDNLHRVQDANKIPDEDRAEYLEYDDGMVLDFVGNHSVRYPSFTIEMETGTGKTYVYLRTIYELNKAYGFRKFIIVVPSIAIYEGVIKNFEIAKSHFGALYYNPTIHLTRYEGERLSNLRSFATSPFIEVLVMTLASFNTKNNVIFKPSEKLPGERLPYEYIQETRPILILDEPQNMGSDKAKAALRTLNPLFALRYSATHRESPNLVYRLSPFDAFQRNLVKRIKVKGITYRENFNQPFLVLKEVVIRRGQKPVAKVRTFVQKGDTPREETITLHQGDNLHYKTHRLEHKDGYIVREIAALKGQDPFVEFENGIILSISDSLGPIRRDLFRLQIRETIERHMETQLRLKPRGIKVLSLFFIDRVANYQDEDGIIKVLFDEGFNRIKKRFPDFRDLEPNRVRSAYFAKRRDKKTGEDVAIDTPVDENARRNKEIREAEKKAFQLIMRDKERLLSFDEPVSFIFAHSALKEGWDNPNVCQICTLNQTVSIIKKRQEIGRGLRICVNQGGERLFGSDINVLTVVANESYEKYASTLQTEYYEEGHAQAPPNPTNADRESAYRVEEHFNLAEFRRFWEKLSCRARYHIHFDTEEFINRCVERLNNRVFPRPMLVVQEAEYVKTSLCLQLEEIQEGKARIQIEIEDTRGRRDKRKDWYEQGYDLEREDLRLRGFRVSEIVEDNDASYVIFSNHKELDLYTPLEFETHEGQQVRERAEFAEQEYYPVFNLLDRVVNEVGLTRKTVLRIFQQMDSMKKTLILKNPEGFTTIFLNTIRNTLADHIVDRLHFQIDTGGDAYDLDELFPEMRDFPQRELVPSPRYGLYSKSQIDSDVEGRFVENRLERDENVICFFKFPLAFKIDFPKVIGNYNPDWGILRRYNAGVILELVRETKGNKDPSKLQFPAERRKIIGAERYFREVGIDYRYVTDQMPDWYHTADQIAVQIKLPEPEPLVEEPSLWIIPNDDPITWDEAFKTMLPVYSLKAAAGYFGAGEPVDPEGWVRVEGLGKLDERMFVAQVVGHSMEPRIKDGDYCVFQADVVGSREGKIVLVQYRGPEDPDTGGSYTVKKYNSEKDVSTEGDWRHVRIMLHPINPEFDPIELTTDDEGQVQVIAEMLKVLI